MMKRIFVFGLTSLLFFGAFQMSCTQAQNTDTALEHKIDKLIGKMTLEEKIGQMNQISSSQNIGEMSVSIKKGFVSSILNEIDPVRINALQRVAVEESRLHIPLLFGRDVIHGFKTVLPIPLGQAATFDPSVVEKGARMAGTEASSVGIRWTFAPMIDIARDPRWGRIAEGCGEDTYLTSVMGVAMVKGFQGNKLNDDSSIAACAKHFAGYGATEGGRDYNSTFIPERILRNVYLPPFEAAAKAGAATFMTSFNDNDGVPSTGNEFLLKQILRKEWGFDGMVVTDWASAHEMVVHGFAADDKEAAMKAVNAGVDMEMVSGTFVQNIPELLKEGKVKQSDIDNAVRNILRLKFRLGLFDRPYVNIKKSSSFYLSANLAVAKQIAEESVILLKNNSSILPLSTNVHTIAIVGPMADAPYEQLGTWTFDGDSAHTQTPLAALRKAVGNKVQILYEPALTYSRDKNTVGIDRAVSVARKADVVLAFVGEEAILSGEAHCLAGLDLQGRQTELIDRLSQTGKPLVTVIMAGRPLTIGKQVEQSTAVLYAFHPGTMGGPAIADILLGKVNPSGKTPITFPKSVGQIPLYYSHNNTGRPTVGNELMINDIPIQSGQTSTGCTSFYLDAGIKPLFPFGYGLSYTDFEYSNVVLSKNSLKVGDTLKITFDLKNIGKYEGTEVAQLYVCDMIGSVTRPVKELKRFARISLKPNEVRQVTFELPISELAFYNLNMVKKVEPGEFQLWVGTNSDSGSSLNFKVLD
jgi:beta-glucosidase